SLLLVAPIFAFAVEGVLTPIIYTGPFLPIFPAWFAWWHGIAALIGFVVVLRSWLLAERTGWLAMASVAIGVFWGLWSSTLWLPENVEDPELLADVGELVVLGPAAFARYAATFTGVLIVSHLLLGFVWPSRAEPHPVAERVVGGLVAIAVVAWTVALPWALPMLALYLWWPWQALRRHRDRVATGPHGGRLDALETVDPVDATGEVRHQDLFAQLSGRVRPVATLPLLLIAPTAVATYAGLWWLGPSDAVLRVLMYTTIAGQAVAGGVLCIVAVRRVRRRGAAVAVGVRSRWSPPTRWFAGSR
ncbi:MAG: hypothetical protein AAFO29_00715, partial [Actinomycetota bacterium]